MFRECIKIFYGINRLNYIISLIFHLLHNKPIKPLLLNYFVPHTAPKKRNKTDTRG